MIGYNEPKAVLNGEPKRFRNSDPKSMCSIHAATQLENVFPDDVVHKVGLRKNFVSQRTDYDSDKR